MNKDSPITKFFYSFQVKQITMLINMRLHALLFGNNLVRAKTYWDLNGPIHNLRSLMNLGDVAED